MSRPGTTLELSEEDVQLIESGNNADGIGSDKVHELFMRVFWNDNNVGDLAEDDGSTAHQQEDGDDDDGKDLELDVSAAAALGDDDAGGASKSDKKSKKSKKDKKDKKNKHSKKADDDDDPSDLDEFLATIAANERGSGDDDDDEEGIDLGDASFQEQLEQEDENAELQADDDFHRWLEGEDMEDVRHPLDEDDDEAARMREALAQSLEARFGVTKLDEDIAGDALPERFAEMARNEHRKPDSLTTSVLGEADELTVDTAQEANWILQQLIKPGFPFERRAASISSNPVLYSKLSAAILEAIDLMLNHKLEPAHLMVYQPQRFAALIEELERCDPGNMAAASLLRDRQEAARSADPNSHPWYAYSTDTGRRQKPAVGGSTVVQLTSSPSSGMAVGALELVNEPASSPVVRRPAFIPLGRLLVEILQLDVACHRYERRRAVALEALEKLQDEGRDLRRRLIDPPNGNGIGLEEKCKQDGPGSFIGRATSSRSQSRAGSTSRSAGYGSAAGGANSSNIANDDAPERGGWYLPTVSDHKALGRTSYQNGFDASIWDDYCDFLNNMQSALHFFEFMEQRIVQQGVENAFAMGGAAAVAAGAADGSGGGVASLPTGYVALTQQGMTITDDFGRVIDSAAWNRSPSVRVLLLGFHKHFNKFVVPGPQLQQNILNKTNPDLHADEPTPEMCIKNSRYNELLGWHKTRLQGAAVYSDRDDTDPLTWAGTLSDMMDQRVSLTAQSILRLFQEALIEQLTVLPVVRDHCFKAFLREGRCEVTPSSRSSDQGLRVVSIQTLLNRDPALFLDLLEEEAGGACAVDFVVDTSVIEAALPLAELLEACGLTDPAASNSQQQEASSALEGDSSHPSADGMTDLRRTHRAAWRKLITSAMVPAARRLMSLLRPHVRSQLREAAQHAVSQRCCQSLGILVAEGPYEPASITKFLQDATTRRQQPGADAGFDQRPRFGADGSSSLSDKTALWPTAWDYLESLPKSGFDTALLAEREGRRRVCAAVRAETGGITVFAFLDTHSQLRQVVRWVETVGSSDEGRRQHKEQSDELLKAIRHFEPEVLAVAPSGTSIKQCWDLFRSIAQCLYRGGLVTEEQRDVALDEERAAEDLGNWEHELTKMRMEHDLDKEKRMAMKKEVQELEKELARLEADAKKYTSKEEERLRADYNKNKEAAAKAAGKQEKAADDTNKAKATAAGTTPDTEDTEVAELDVTRSKAAKSTKEDEAADDNDGGEAAQRGGGDDGDDDATAMKADTDNSADEQVAADAAASQRKQKEEDTEEWKRLQAQIAAIQPEPELARQIANKKSELQPKKADLNANETLRNEELKTAQEAVLRARDRLSKARETVSSALGPKNRQQSSVPIVWASAVIAKIMAGASAINEELREQDVALRTAVALARHVQEPMRALASLFDHKEPHRGGTVGRLPLGCDYYRESVLPRGALFDSLQWEMTLWVAASGVDVNALLHIPPAYAERLLQFVPGLGYRKAERLFKALSRTTVQSRQTLDKVIVEEFAEGRYERTRNQHRVNQDGSDAEESDEEEEEDNDDHHPSRSKHSKKSKKDGKKDSSNNNKKTAVAAATSDGEVPKDEEESVDGKKKAVPWSEYKNHATSINALPTLRVRMEDTADHSEDSVSASSLLLDYQVLDATLIPPQWYSVANHLVQQLTAFQGRHALVPSAAHTFFRDFRCFSERHRAISDIMRRFGLDAAVAQSQAGSVAERYPSEGGNKVFALGSSEVQFIADELIAAGASRARRRFRNMTDARFFSLVTGQTYVPERRQQHQMIAGAQPAGADAALAGTVSSMMTSTIINDRRNHALLCVDDIVEGVPESIRVIGTRADAGPTPVLRGHANSVPGEEEFVIKCRGSHGMILQFNGRDLPEVLRRPCLDAIREGTERYNVRFQAEMTRAMQQAQMAGTGMHPMERRPPTFFMAPYALKQVTIYGRVQSVELSSGEARCGFEKEPPSQLAQQRAAAEALAAMHHRSRTHSHAALAAALAGSTNKSGSTSARSDSGGNRSDVHSVASVALLAPSRGNALRASNHPLFRHMEHSGVLKALENATIGEALIRPNRTPKYGDVIVSVKAGYEVNSVINIPVFEERRPGGQIYYRLVDDVHEGATKSLEFIDLDHMLERYVRPMGRLFRDLCEHRRFFSGTTREAMLEEMASKSEGNENAFIYCIWEVSNHARCIYEVDYYIPRMGDIKKHTMKLRVTASGNRLAMEHPLRRGTWIYATSAEDMTKKLKDVVLRRQK